MTEVFACALCEGSAGENGAEYEWTYGICGACAHRITVMFIQKHDIPLEVRGQNSAGPKKRKISFGLRMKVFERDDFTCKHCGARKNLCADHIHPESLGGETNLDNLQTLCRSCNSRKGARVS